MWRIGELELIKRSHEYQMRTTNTGPRRPLQNECGRHAQHLLLIDKSPPTRLPGTPKPL
jgi:hypothetical protein